ncbi:MAG TPA: hypothetical protein VIJ34_10230, partial [Acidimicrobiales bacterium]
IQVSGLHQFLAMMSSFGALAPLLEQMGSATAVEQKSLSAIQGLAAMSASEKVLPVIGSIAGSLNVKVALELDVAAVLADSWDVDASVLVKVQRVIKSGEKYVVGDAFGGLLRMMPTEQQAELIETLKSPDSARFGIGEMEISAPAFVGTPVAIYR